MIPRSFVFAAAALALSAGSAGAVSYSANQGDRLDGSDVPPDRSDINAVSDGDAATFYSLGIDGTLSADVSPLFIAGGSVIEVTHGTINADFPESAEVWLGGSVSGGLFDSTGAVLFGELFNTGAAPTFDPTLGTITKSSQGGNQTVWDLALTSLTYSLITLVDTTEVNFADVYTKNGINNDGFDVGEFNVQAVPLPASVLMLLGALGGLGFIGRRRHAEA